MTLTTEWPENVEEAIAIQQQLRLQVRIESLSVEPHLIAGADVGYDIATNTSYAVVTLMKLNVLKPITIVRAELPTQFPYVPGLLSFREIPVLLEALKKLTQTPDLIMVDGQGIAHPRRLGIAAHLGVLLDKPTIGVAKSRLVGSFQDPGPTRGDHTVLTHKNERIGTVLRSKRGCLPLFISPGHRVDHAGAVDMVMRCLTTYRLPEPTRIADKYSKKALRDQIV